MDSFFFSFASISFLTFGAFWDVGKTITVLNKIKPLIQKNICRTIETIAKVKDKGLHTYPKDISAKVNVLARLEFELAYYDVAVQCVYHNVM